MNLFSCTGNVGRDAQVRNAGNSTVCSFAVGVSSGWGDNKSTLWLDCSIWGKQAEGQLPQYLTKGAKVALTGELGEREYTANDGTQKKVLTMRVNTIDLIGSREAQAAPPPPPKPVQNQQAAMPNHTIDDDIPFTSFLKGKEYLV